MCSIGVCRVLILMAVMLTLATLQLSLTGERNGVLSQREVG